MAGVLTLASNVTCGHAPGKVATSSSAKLTVAGSAVLVRTSIEGHAVGGCGTVPSSDASGPIDVTCLTVTSVTGGEATKLKAAGNPVVLDTLAGDTSGLVAKNPAKALAGTAGQTKLTAS